MTSTRWSGAGKGPFAIALLGVAILLAGVVRYVLARNFSLAQAIYCAISIPAALLLLMVFDYTLHHARIVCLMLLLTLVLLTVRSPAFCVGLGLAFLGMVVTARP